MLVAGLGLVRAAPRTAAARTASHEG